MQPPAILLNGITQETRVTTAVAIASHGPGSETGSPAPVNGRPRSRRLGAWYVALRPGTSFWTAVSCFHHETAVQKLVPGRSATYHAPSLRDRGRPFTGA